MAARLSSAQDGKARPALRVGAAVVVAGSGVLSGVAGGDLAAVAPVHRAIILTDSSSAASGPTFEQSLYALLNTPGGMGGKTLPELVGGKETVGDLLGGSGLSVSTPLGNPALLDMLGMDKYTLGDVLTDLGFNPSTMTVDAALEKMQLANVTLDDILTPLGIPSTETTMGLADRFSVAHLTLDEMLQRVGFSGNETFDQVLTQMNLNGTALPTMIGALALVGNLGYCPSALSGSTTIDTFISCLTLDAATNGGTDAKNHALPAPIHLSGNTTIQQILESQHFYDANSDHTDEIIGNWTIGQILNFNSTTTIEQFVNNLHVNLGVTSDPSGGTPSTPSGGDTEQSPGDDDGSGAVPVGGNVSNLPTLGGEHLSGLLSWINLNPDDTIADVVTNLIKVGTQSLGDATIQSTLDAMLLDPLAIGPSPSEVQDSTPLADLLTGMGMGTQTLDQLLNLTAP